MARLRRIAAGLVVSIGIPAGAAMAQVRLPGVVVSAPVDKPGARLLVGVVRDTSQFAIDSAEVTIPELKRRLMSDSAGKFKFADIKPGKYVVRARKIGYAPTAAIVDVDSAGGVGTLDMLQLRRVLPAMVIAVARHGISGVVGDTSYRAIPGAEVKLLGQGMFALSDSLGGFFFDVKPGKYQLSFRRDGYADKIVGVNVPVDSGRRVDVFLGPRGPVPAREAHNIDDFGARLAGRMSTTSTIYNHDDLVSMGYEWLSEAIQGGYARAGGKGSVGNGCAAVLNGGRQYVMIDALTVDDVETVEIYPSTGITKVPSTARPKAGVPVGKKGIASFNIQMPMSNTDLADWRNSGRDDCPRVYVWTR